MSSEFMTTTKRRIAASVDTVTKNAVAIEETLESIPERVARTMHWAQLQEWQRDNEYILTGYRMVQNSWKGCLESVFGYLHNESVNIHSHLIGAVIFAVCLFTFFPSILAKYETATWVDISGLAVFLGAAVFCLGASSVFHMSQCHSQAVADSCILLDYAGIVIMIVGSFFPAIHYAFYCETHWKTLYLSIMVFFGLIATYIVFNPEYSKPSHRGARTLVFVILGLSAVLPVMHAFAAQGFHKVATDMGFRWIIASGVFYLIGATLYANRIPERLSPGSFDYFFSSHQIFHVHVVLAALSHYVGVLTGLHHWHGTLGGYCPA